MKKVDAKWKEVPSPSEIKSVLPYLNKISEVAAADVQKHKQEEKKGLCAGRRWKKELEEKEEHRRLVSQIKAVCVVLHVEARRKKHKEHAEKTCLPKVSGTGQTRK